MDSPEIVHATPKNRFEIRLGRAVIGKTFYRPEAGRRVFTHTEVEPDYQGHGLASQLIEHALNETRDAGLKVVALCPTVSAFIAKRPEYQDLLDEKQV